MKLHRAGLDAPTQRRRAIKTITLTGAAGLGAVGDITIWTVSGFIFIEKLIPICTADLISAGGGSISFGHSANKAAFVAATVATNIDNNEYWLTTSPGVGAVVPAALLTGSLLAPNSIVCEVTVADVTAGSLVFFIEYFPVSAGATLS